MSPPLALLAGDVHVWRAQLGRTQPELERLRALLSAEEHERSRRFRFANDRDYFVATRGILRELLSRYTATDPATLRFAQDAAGKPSLAPEHSASGVQFNVSHTDGLAVFAFSAHRAVGVDVERIDHGFDFGDVVGRYFTAREQFVLSTTPQLEKTRTFYRYWTCKEAFLKCTGKGVQGLRDGFEVQLGGDGAGAVLEPAGWSLHELGVGARYCAALAVEGARARVVPMVWVGHNATDARAGSDRRSAGAPAAAVSGLS